MPLIEFDESVIDDILHVGRGNQEMLAFKPTDENNIGYDSVIVMPRRGGGRVVFMVHCQTSDRPRVPPCDALRDDDERPTNDAKRPQPARNHRFLQHLQTRSRAMYPDGGYPTDVVFVLASVTDDTAERFRATGSPHDELRLDLKWMEHWCPTVAFATQAVMQLWSVAAESMEGAERNGPQQREQTSCTRRYRRRQAKREYRENPAPPLGTVRRNGQRNSARQLAATTARSRPNRA